MPQDPLKKLVLKTIPGRPEHKATGIRRFRGRHLFMLLVIAGLAFAGYRQYFKPSPAPSVTAIISAPAKTAELDVPPLTEPAPSREEASDTFELRHQVVRPGESLPMILAALGISGDQVRDWELACGSSPMASVNEGGEIFVFLSPGEKEPVRIINAAPGGDSFTMRKSSEGWECKPREPAPKTPVRTVACRYAENFYDSCISGGLPATLISPLADIFSYDVDFTSEFKDGDTFTVYFQEQDIEGSEGKQYLILAAEMNIAGKVYQAFGFQLPEGGWEYFDAKGASLKRAFLKGPISYRRLISPSTYKNVKPVLKIYRPHTGIDYAAPRGTPVSAIGDGVVSSLKTRGKSSITIEIRHRGGFKSVYGHLSAYSRGLQRGGIVSQGEVIGSVGPGAGKTYLGFHFYRNGKPVNFHTTDFPRTLSIPKTSRQEFEKTRDTYLAALRIIASRGQDFPPGRE